MSEEVSIYQGKCHCSEVQFEIETDLKKVVRCNCSLCIKKGAIMHLVPNSQFKLKKGEQNLKLYQFHTKTAQHYFCNICGIYTFHRPRTKPEFYGVNVGCLENVDPFSLEVGLVDGRAYD